MTPKKWIAVYSEKATRFGTSIYAREDGTEVEITAVFDTEEGVSGYLWDDKVILGEVVRWVRGNRPNLSNKDFLPERDYYFK